jgi:hypothetical protein
MVRATITLWCLLGLTMTLGPALAAQEFGPQPLAENLKQTAGEAAEKKAPESVEEAPAGKPKILIRESHWDWGEIFQGESASNSFIVENIGTAPLRITNVKPGCSCTVSDKKYKKILEPGEKTRISLVIDTNKMKQSNKKYSKSATITTNDPMQPQYKVHLSGKVKQVLQPEPKNLKFTALAGSGEGITGEFELRVPDEDVTVELEKLSVSGKKFVTVDEITELEPGKRWKVKFSSEPNAKPATKRAKLSARVKVNGGKRLIVPVQLSMSFRDRIEVSPKGTLTFKKSQTAKLLTGEGSVSREISVSSGETGVQFSVTNVELIDVPPGLFETDIAVIKPGTAYNVIVTLKQHVNQRFVRGTVRIHTDDPSSPPKELRIFARFDSSTAKK